MAAFALSCAHGEKTDAPWVQSLRFRGNEVIDDSALEDKILTAESSWIPLFGRKHPFDANVWRGDLRRIERFYQQRGYHQARVVRDEVKSDGKGRVSLLVEIEEGPPTTVRRVEVSGLEPLTESQQRRLRRQVDFAPGEVFLEERWKGLEGRLLDRLSELGHVQATVDAEARVDLALQHADVEVRIDPKRRFTFGDVVVEQAPGSVVERWRIEEQAKEAIEDEDWYSTSALEEVQGRIFRMGVFGAARVSPGTPDEASGRVPVRIETQEAPFNTARGGIGLGVEQLRWDAHLLVGYANRNFLGGLRKFDVNGRFGWAWLPNSYSFQADQLSRGGPIARVTVDFQQPRLGSPNYALQTRAEVERSIEPAYSYTGGRSRVGVVWQPWTWLSVTPSYNFEVYRLDAGQARPDSNAPTLLYGCPETCLLSYLEQIVELDRRNDPQEPRRGYYFSLSFQEGGGPLGGSFTYLRVTPEARAYLSQRVVDRLVTFSARGRLGSLFPTSGDPLSSPIVARYYSGGDFMRGFSTRRLSPMVIVQRPNPVVDPTDPRRQRIITGEPVPIGGNGLVELQLEARTRIRGDFVGATFVDTGFVTSENLARLDTPFLSQLQLAVGGGVRYRTPVGPLRLDLAYRPDVGAPLQVYQEPGRELTYQQDPGCFGLWPSRRTRAGSPEGPCSIHLSIGEAF